MKKHSQPANVLALAARCVSVAFSSLPTAVADSVSSAAERAGIARQGKKKVRNITVRRAKVADRAKKLGKYKPIKPSSKAIGTPRAARRVVVLNGNGRLPLRALPAEVQRGFQALAGRIGSGGTGARGATGARGKTGARGPAGSTGPQGIQGLIGPQGAQGLLGPQGPVGSVSNVVVRTAESTAGTLVDPLRTATATCQAGEKLLGGSGYAGSGILTPVTGLLSSSLLQFVSTAGGVPVPDGTSNGNSFSSKGDVVGGKVISQAFCATS